MECKFFVGWVVGIGGSKSTFMLFLCIIANPLVGVVDRLCDGVVWYFQGCLYFVSFVDVWVMICNECF